MTNSHTPSRCHSFLGSFLFIHFNSKWEKKSMLKSILKSIPKHQHLWPTFLFFFNIFFLILDSNWIEIHIDYYYSMVVVVYSFLWWLLFVTVMHCMTKTHKQKRKRKRKSFFHFFYGYFEKNSTRDFVPETWIVFSVCVCMMTLSLSVISNCFFFLNGIQFFFTLVYLMVVWCWWYSVRKLISKWIIYCGGGGGVGVNDDHHH